MIDVETAFKMATVGLKHYLENKNTLSSNMIIMHEKKKPRYTISRTAKDIEKGMTDLNFTTNPNKPTTEMQKY